MRLSNRAILAVVLVGTLQAPSAYSDEMSVQEKSFVETLYASALAAGAPLMNTVVAAVTAAAVAGVFYGMHIQKQRIYAAHTGLQQGGVLLRLRDLDGHTLTDKLNCLRKDAYDIGTAAGYRQYEQELADTHVPNGFSKAIRFGAIEGRTLVTKFSNLVSWLVEQIDTSRKLAVAKK